jgi:hypothetical protein
MLLSLRRHCHNKLDVVMMSSVITVVFATAAASTILSTLVEAAIFGVRSPIYQAVRCSSDSVDWLANPTQQQAQSLLSRTRAVKKAESNALYTPDLLVRGGQSVEAEHEQRNHVGASDESSPVTDLYLPGLLKAVVDKSSKVRQGLVLPRLLL